MQLLIAECPTHQHTRALVTQPHVLAVLRSTAWCHVLVVQNPCVPVIRRRCVGGCHSGSEAAALILRKQQPPRTPLKIPVQQLLLLGQPHSTEQAITCQPRNRETHASTVELRLAAQPQVNQGHHPTHKLAGASSTRPPAQCKAAVTAAGEQLRSGCLLFSALVTAHAIHSRHPPCSPPPASTSHKVHVFP